jgi:hypothetical protein
VSVTAGYTTVFRMFLHNDSAVQQTRQNVTLGLQDRIRQQQMSVEQGTDWKGDDL